MGVGARKSHNRSLYPQASYVQKQCCAEPSPLQFVPRSCTRGGGNAFCKSSNISTCCQGGVHNLTTHRYVFHFSFLGFVGRREGGIVPSWITTAMSRRALKMLPTAGGVDAGIRMVLASTSPMSVAVHYGGMVVVVVMGDGGDDGDGCDGDGGCG